MPASQSRRARRQRMKQDQDQEQQAPGRPYVYNSLPTESSIRLLELLHSPKGEIHCALRTVDLQDDPIFDALSYSWANPITIREKPFSYDEEGVQSICKLLSLQRIPTVTQPNMVNLDPMAMSFLTVHQSLPYVDREDGRARCERITCAGQELQVTETLFTTLLQLQHLLTSKSLTEEVGMTYFESLPEPRSKYIWIDQICIDQQNLDERSAQVPLMNKIFAAAQYVFAWIGELDDLGYLGLTVALDRGRRQEPHSRPEHSDASYERLGKERKDLYALAALLSRQWFRRAWVNLLWHLQYGLC
jgi:hypothetical protein